MSRKKTVASLSAIILFIFILGLAGCGRIPPGNATITVNDGQDPIVGTTVTLEDEVGQTDAQGQVTFYDVPAGEHQFAATKEGYATKTGQIVVESKKTATATISLTRQTGNVTVTVNDGTDPIENATVQAGGETATTDASGQACLTLPTGTYTVSASKDGYTGNTGEITVVNGSVATAVISLTRQTGNATITVTDGTTPIEGADVMMGEVTKRTDSLGQVSFTLPTEVYVATASKDGYSGNTADVAITSGATATATIALARQAGNATITVTDSTSPIMGASVLLNGVTKTTDTLGQVSFGLPTGDYVATASKDGYTSNTASITITNGTTATATIGLTRQTGSATITVTDGTNPLSGASVVLDGVTKTTDSLGQVGYTLPTGDYVATASKDGYASNTANMTFTSGGTATAAIALTRQTGSATITVTDGANPLSGASVLLDGVTRTTDSLGQVNCTLPTGDYAATASKDGYTSNAASITITSGATATATIALTRQIGSVTITVTDGTIPIIGADVLLNGVAKTTDALGQVSYTLPTGDYVAAASKPGYTSKTASITITNGGTATATIALTRQTGSATITVNDGASPIANATVVLNGTTKTTNAQGQTSFTGIPTGTYTASASASSYSANSADVNIVFNSTATATISLIRDSGNVSVWVFDHSNFGSIGNVSMSGVSVTMNGRTVQTNSMGRADFNNIPTGTYTAQVSYSGFMPGSVSVTVSKGHTTDDYYMLGCYAISLDKPTGQILITLKRGDGVTPLVGATVTLQTSPSRSATTDGSGNVTFDNVTNGTYSVYMLPASGYYPMTTSITVDDTHRTFTYSSQWW